MIGCLVERSSLAIMRLFRKMAVLPSWNRRKHLPPRKRNRVSHESVNIPWSMDTSMERKPLHSLKPIFANKRRNERIITRRIAFIRDYLLISKHFDMVVPPR